MKVLINSIMITSFWKSIIGTFKTYEEIVRYYGVGILNTAFGFALYAIFVYFFKNRFSAQIASHIIGAISNYMMFRRYVFREADANIYRYVIAYLLNYLMGLTSLWSVSHFIRSPYIAGLVSLFVISFINYFVLKSIVFRARIDRSGV